MQLNHLVVEEKKKHTAFFPKLTEHINLSWKEFPPVVFQIIPMNLQF